MTHIVTANKGYVSRSMSKIEAKRYARQLKQLGNYNIKVVEASDDLLSHQVGEMEE